MVSKHVHQFFDNLYNKKLSFIPLPLNLVRQYSFSSNKKNMVEVMLVT